MSGTSIYITSNHLSLQTLIFKSLFEIRNTFHMYNITIWTGGWIPLNHDKEVLWISHSFFLINIYNLSGDIHLHPI